MLGADVLAVETVPYVDEAEVLVALVSAGARAAG
jgi:S-methylmethionine-dependent homocysteine/selenocysteine methylase